MITVNFAYRHSLQTAVFVLREGGFCRKYGLEGIFNHVPNTQEAEDGLLEGKYSFVFGNHVEPYLDRVRRGAKIIYLAQASNYWPDRLVANPEINSLKDLKGKKIAVLAKGDHPELIVRQRFRDVGLDIEKDNIEEVEVEKINMMKAYKMVLEREVSAAFMLPPFDYKAKKDGLKVIELSPFPQIWGVTLATTSDFADKNEETVMNVLKAFVDAIHYFITEKERTLEILSKELRDALELEGDAIEHLYKETVKTLEKKPYPTLDAIRNLYNLTLVAYPEIKVINPLMLWDLHFLRRLDESGFIDDLYK